MANPLGSALVRYGMGLSSAAVLLVLALTVFEGTLRTVVLALAVVEAVFVPQFLKYAAG
jgi:hypothetical protein